MCDTFYWLSAYIWNTFLICQTEAQILTFIEPMICYWIAPFGMDPEHSGHSEFTIDPFGEKYKSGLHMIHTSHRRLFLHQKLCIGVQIWYILNQTSVSCVNIVLFKGKFRQTSGYLGAPDPSKAVFIRTARPELVGLAF